MSEQPRTTSLAPVRSSEAIWRNEDARARRRWTFCFASVAALHGAVAMIVAWWLSPLERTAATLPSAIMIEMAPVAATAAAQPTDMAVGPQQQRAVSVKPLRSVAVPNLPRVPQAPVPLASDTQPQQSPPEDRTRLARTAVGPSGAVQAVYQPSRVAPRAGRRLCDLLDAEALALLQRAQPLPKPPASVPGESLELVVPLEFFLTR